MVEWFRALDLKSGGPRFKSSTLPLSGFVLGSLCSLSVASHQLGFLIVSVIFTIFVYIFTVSSISTAVLNTLDT